jgi:hypothetical protein
LAFEINGPEIYLTMSLLRAPNFKISTFRNPTKQRPQPSADGSPYEPFREFVEWLQPP